MRFGTIFTSILSLAALVLSNEVVETSETDVVATAAFPETNAFNYVVNGQKNSLTVTVERVSDRNVTVTKIAGALLDPDTNTLIKNLTSQKHTVPLPLKKKLAIPYAFHSEFKPGDHRLNIWLEHTTESGTSRVEAYDSVVTVVDPEFSIFDFKLLTTYAIVAVFLAGLVYIAYRSFVPQSKKSKSKKPTASSVSSPVGVVTATGTGGYQEEWIPEHHLRKAKPGKKNTVGGEELSGGETSGAEGKRKAKK